MFNIKRSKEQKARDSAFKALGSDYNVYKTGINNDPNYKHQRVRLSNAQKKHIPSIVKRYKSMLSNMDPGDKGRAELQAKVNYIEAYYPDLLKTPDKISHKHNNVSVDLSDKFGDGMRKFTAIQHFDLVSDMMRAGHIDPQKHSTKLTHLNIAAARAILKERGTGGTIEEGALLIRERLSARHEALQEKDYVSQWDKAYDMVEAGVVENTDQNIKEIFRIKHNCKSQLLRKYLQSGGEVDRKRVMDQSYLDKLTSTLLDNHTKERKKLQMQQQMKQSLANQKSKHISSQSIEISDDQYEQRMNDSSNNKQVSSNEQTNKPISKSKQNHNLNNSMNKNDFNDMML